MSSFFGLVAESASSNKFWLEQIHSFEAFVCCFAHSTRFLLTRFILM
ncbi:unnamed protein product [Brassica rapa subsp. trilocularis]